MEEYFLKAAASELEQIADNMKYLIDKLEQSRQDLPTVWSDQAAVLCTRALDDLITCSHNQYESILTLSIDINLESDNLEFGNLESGNLESGNLESGNPESDSLEFDIIQIDSDI